MKLSKDTKVETGILKQRLVGIVVLLALAVIIIPMVLDFRKDYDEVIMGTNIPPKPDNFRVEVLPLEPIDKPRPSLPPVVEPQPAAEKLPEQPVSEEPPRPSNAKVESPDKPDVATDDKQQSVPVPKAMPEAVVWRVQVGSFSEEQNALALDKRLKERGYNTLIDKVMVGDKQIFRLRVGAEESRSRAETLRAILAEEMQVDGIVVSGQ